MEATAAHGLTDAAPAYGFGVVATDYDDDGRLDLVLTTFAHDTKTLYRNLDGSQFEDVSVRSGLAAAAFAPSCRRPSGRGTSSC